MYQLITKSDFHDAFRLMGRLDNFSYEGRSALYDWLIDMEDNEIGQELDVIGLCCDFYEDSIENVFKEYEINSLEDLHAETIIIWHDDKSVLYQAF